MGCSSSATASSEPAQRPAGDVTQPATQVSQASPKPSNVQEHSSPVTQPTKPVSQASSNSSNGQTAQSAHSAHVTQPTKPVSKGILISCHSINKEIATQLADTLSSKGFDPLIVTESFPAQLSTRAQAVDWAQYVLLVTSFKYQRNQSCMELANFAKDTKKPLQAIVVQPNYRPSGALGALSIAGGKALDFRQHTDQSVYSRSVEDLIACLESKVVDEPAVPLSKPNLADEDEVGRTSQATPSKGSGIYISYHAEAADVARLVSQGRGTSNSLGLHVKLGDPSANNLAAIKSCGTFIAIMSNGYQHSEKFQEEFECARAGHKKIVPVNGEKGFRPGGWLALAIAGKLYYVLQDEGQAYQAHQNVPDSNPMNDFIYAVLAPDPPTEEEVEKAEIAALRKQLEEAKAKLDAWPPPKRPIVEEEELPSLTPEDLAPETGEHLVFNYIHHEVTRMTFNAPKPLFDERGVPTKQKFDVMLSYQWGIQNFVRDVYMDLDIRTFKAWMDVWGGMLGNINSAMAAAVETSSVLLSFLTEKYQQSVNCNLELKYAIERKKPIVFIKAEKDLVLRDWIQEAVSKSVVFELSSIQDAGIKDDGVPRINRICEAIRKLASWEAKRLQVRDDASEEVFQLQDQLEDALYLIHEEAGTKRYETCTRCEAKFDENSADGCKKHRAYYMGGTILAGRWVCCQQREKATPGCENARHINQPREFVEMPGHGGCFKWEPE